MGSEVLAHGAAGAVERDGTGRSRKGSAKWMSHVHMWIVGDSGGRKRLGQWDGWMIEQNCWVLLPQGTAGWVEKEQDPPAGSCRKACATTAALLPGCPLLC